MKPKKSRFVAYNRFVDHVARYCRPAELRVWFYLWRRANRDGRLVFRVQDVADATGLTWKSAKQAILSLKSIGCLGVKWGNNWDRHLAVVDVLEMWEKECHPVRLQEIQKKKLSVP